MKSKPSIYDIRLALAALLLIAISVSGETHNFPMRSGANLPWTVHTVDGYSHYGWDLGRHPWNSSGHEGYSSSVSSLKEDFAYMATNKVKLCRVFLFCDFRTGLEFDDDGYVTGFDPWVYPDMDALLDCASRNDIKLIPVLMDYMLVDGQHHGSSGGEHPGFITNAVAQAAFMDNLLKPFIQRYGTNENVYAWEIMNEPGEATAVPKADLAQFIDLCASNILVECPDVLVTCGIYNTDEIDLWMTPHLNFMQLHQYPGSSWDLDKPATDWSDNPVLIGEIPITSDYTQLLETARESGYLGVLAWSLNDPYYSFTLSESGYMPYMINLFYTMNLPLTLDIEVTPSDVRLHLSPTYEGNKYFLHQATDLTAPEWATNTYPAASGTNSTEIIFSKDSSSEFYKVITDL